MKSIWIFAVVALGGGVYLFLDGQQELAAAFVSFVFAIYYKLQDMRKENALKVIQSQLKQSDCDDVDIMENIETAIGGGGIKNPPPKK